MPHDALGHGLLELLAQPVPQNVPRPAELSEIADHAHAQIARGQGHARSPEGLLPEPVFADGRAQAPQQGPRAFLVQIRGDEAEHAVVHGRQPVVIAQLPPQRGPDPVLEPLHPAFAVTGAQVAQARNRQYAEGHPALPAADAVDLFVQIGPEALGVHESRLPIQGPGRSEIAAQGHGAQGAPELPLQFHVHPGTGNVVVHGVPAGEHRDQVALGAQQDDVRRAQGAPRLPGPDQGAELEARDVHTLGGHEEAVVLDVLGQGHGLEMPADAIGLQAETVQDDHDFPGDVVVGFDEKESEPLLVFHVPDHGRCLRSARDGGTSA